MANDLPGKPKLRVLMMCAHEPTVDPRIRWEAEFAADQFDVTVLGFKEASSTRPEFEDVASYKMVRRKRFDLNPGYYLWRFKDVFSKVALGILLGLAIVLYPFLLIGEILFRGGRYLGRGMRLIGSGLVTISIPLSLLQGLRPTRRKSENRKERLHYILALLRMQFGPAAAIFRNHIDHMQPKPDVVHCNDLDTLLPGVLAKRAHGCRLVYDAHEFYPVADSLCGWLDTTFFTFVERRLIRHCDAVVTVNPMLASAMQSAYSLKRVYSVPNVEVWLDDRPALDPASTMSKLAGNRIKFLFQGRFTPKRGVEEIIHAWSLVDGGKAALFLRGPDNHWRKGAMELASKLGLLDRSVYFLGSVTEDMLVSAAGEADVGIVPYLPIAINERLSCPNKLSQYMHAGLMVICNDLPYVKSVVAAADAGLSYSSDDLQTLADAVAQVTNDPQLLQRCRENAQRFAKADFNWQVHGKTFLQLYAGEQPAEPVRLDAVA